MTALPTTTASVGTPLEAFLDRWHDDPRLVRVHRLPARGARFGALTEPLPREVWYRLGIDALWSHQAEAIDLVRQGRSVVIATGTASGKSLCYQAPIAEAVAASSPGTALLLFPTKALAQDQLRAITAPGFPRLAAGTYDGDTPPDTRTWVRNHANVVLTNPEMLHHGILPSHGRWATFLHRLRYVVVDELHVLRGVFGSHVAHLLRRLRRLCLHYGADPTFLFTSATVGQPEVLAGALADLDVRAVVDDGSPRGERLLALWNPNADDPAGLRASAPRDTALLTAALVTEGNRTIAFCRSRKATEVVAADVKRRVPGPLSAAVRPYRGGYLPAERRAIEAELFRGDLQAVVATTALELGVDIDGLDACVLCGYPGTAASLWQQAGRAGRSDAPSLAVLVAGDDQLDQWLMLHPDEVWTRAAEPVVINPANPSIAVPHLACAAYELPLRRTDERWWPEVLDDGIRALVLDGKLRVRRDESAPGTPTPPADPAAVWADRGRPSSGVGLRSASTDEFRITDRSGDLVGTVEDGRAFSLVHEGAVYLHQGQTWRVSELDLDDRVAYVEPCDGGEYTQARTASDITVLGVDRRRTVGRSELALGPVRVISEVTGYRRLDSFSGKLLGIHDLDLPPSQLVTRGFWYTFAPEVLDDAGIGVDALGGTLHAAEHTAIALLPLFTICDRWDVGGLSTPVLADTGLPTIVIYDGYQGGAGVAELGFEAADAHLRATLDLLEACPCPSGCPSCVQSPKCGNGNEPLDKHGAIALLRTVLSG